jgi:hypothetical protein
MASTETHSAVSVRSFRLLGLLVLAGWLTGCTLRIGTMPPEHGPQVTTVEVSLDPKVNEPLKEPVKASLDVAPVLDTQWATNKCLLAYLGDESRILASQRPLTEIFQDGLSNALRQNGFMSTNQPRYVLKTEFKAFGWLPVEVALPPEYQQFGLTTGFDDVPTEFRMPGSLSVDSGPPRRLAVLVLYRLFDSQRKRPAWSFSPQPEWEFECYGVLRSLEHPYYPERERGEAFAVTAEDAIRQLIDDQKFRAFFETQSTNAP